MSCLSNFFSKFRISKENNNLVIRFRLYQEKRVMKKIDKLEIKLKKIQDKIINQ